MLILKNTLGTWHGAIAANVYANSLPDGRGDALPYVGGTVIGILLLLMPWRRPERTRSRASASYGFAKPA